MEQMNQPQTLQNALKKYRIPEMFDTEGLSFSLLRYQKGEYLAAPNIPPERLLFLVKGRVQIYGILEDGGLSPVAVQRPGALLGDLEFASGLPSPFFAEARSEALCVALPLVRYREALHRDVRFLNTVLQSVADRFDRVSLLEANSRTLRDKLLHQLREQSKGGRIQSVSEMVMQLRCSRRQLQRVLARLCEEGLLIKEKKGCYRLAEKPAGSEAAE